jgi:hypothetical protein
VLCLSLAAAGGEAVKFSQKPSAKKNGGKTVIEFAAGGKTDCAVYILDAKGKCVRHLAAGVLGEKAPAPLKPGLVQKLEWDGKDDTGKPAAGGPFKVRVGLGLKPTFDRVIGHNPGGIRSVRALAVGPKGEIFVFHCFGTVHPSDNSMACSVFSREGKYLREILPYPANLPEEKLKGLKRIKLDDGRTVPFIYQAETRSLIPGAAENQNHEAIVTSDGRVGFVGRMEHLRYAQAGPIHLLQINSDGSVPDDGVVKTKIFARGTSATLALSPDEKTVYASDVRKSKGHYGLPINVVYKFGWTDAKPTPFAGGKDASGEKALKDPKGISVDKDGNLYVCDKGKDRVAIFKPDGSFVGALEVNAPERVAVSRKTGTVYVVGGPNISELKKFKSWKEKTPVATAKVPFFKHGGYRVSMVLEESADPPALWLATHAGYYARFKLLRIEDKGASFGDQVDVGKLPENSRPDCGAVGDVNLDRETETVYVGRGPRFDGRTGKVEKVTVPVPRTSYRAGAVIALGLDGRVYLHGSGKQKGVYRFDRAMKPLPFEGGDSNYIANLGSLRLRGRGLTADHRGRVYLLYQKPKGEQSPGDHGDANALALYGPDGKVINEKLVDSEMRSINSVRVDYAGNIYLLAGLRPGKESLPPGLAGKLPAGGKDPTAVAGVNYYAYIYGSVVKFGPEGGVIRKGSGGTACNYNVGLSTEVKGAKWIFPGASNVPSWRTPAPKYYTPDICLCESPRFDVDGFGRSFFPDAGRFQVGIIDTGGNEIGWFGAYGNQDSLGAGKAFSPTADNPQSATSNPRSGGGHPEIPLCWPQAVAVGDEAVYVGDRLNRRVVRVKLDYAAEETCAVR